MICFSPATPTSTPISAEIEFRSQQVKVVPQMKFKHFILLGRNTLRGLGGAQRQSA